MSKECDMFLNFPAICRADIHTCVTFGFVFGLFRKWAQSDTTPSSGTSVMGSIYKISPRFTILFGPLGTFLLGYSFLLSSLKKRPLGFFLDELQKKAPANQSY
eukprot:Phypoly_transcript_10088.p1 GENE.Phypoly_transcript_10088~~Phypoly_transcript_10088.p1  ORF type:complete len:103 (+),score=10.65 Phypoly_transcript_10088:724-1032(+)